MRGVRIFLCGVWVAIRGGGERRRKILASRMKLSVPSVSPMAWLCYFPFKSHVGELSTPALLSLFSALLPLLELGGVRSLRGKRG